MEDLKAFTLATQGGILRQLTTQVFYSMAFVPQEGAPQPEIKEFTGVWDTGASGSVISHEVVRQLGLIPISQQRVLHTQGADIVYVYRVNIFLPNRIVIPNVTVTEGNVNLIGMDIIGLGDFALCNRDQKTVFSFQIPSSHCYDFVKQIEQQKSKAKKKR